ncbi:MAG: ABC transporter permease [Firmicutes bacterium]|nr:ABC transporter permease [Bacillota bacterium]
MMPLVQLGLVNALRNSGRSLLTVVAMAVAAFLATSSITASEGHTPQRAWEYRSYLGGDILVYPQWAWPTESDISVAAESGSVRLVRLRPWFGSPLYYFHPDFYSRGYLTPDPDGAPKYSMFDTPADMAGSLETLRRVDGVTAVVPYTCVPVVRGEVRAAGRGGKTVALPVDGFFLRACPPNLLEDASPEQAGELGLAEPQRDPPPVVTVSRGAGQTFGEVATWHGGVYTPSQAASRFLRKDDADRLVAVVNRRALIGRQDLGSTTVLLDSEGQKVRLTLPRIVTAPDGRAHYDFAHPVEVEVSLVGVYDVASRVHAWVQGDTVTYEQLYLEAPEILMPRPALERVLGLMGLPPGGLEPAGAVALRVDNQLKVERVVEEVRQSVPGLSAVSVAEEAAFANAHGLPEKTYVCPQRRRPLPSSQPAVPAAKQGLFGLTLFAFAGIAAAGNATLVVLSRRTEFAVLKAVGLRSWEVALMVMVELLTLGSLGLTAGFAAGEAAVLPVRLANTAAAGTLARDVLRDLGLVAAATLGTSALAALVPMARSLRITVAEAMRGDE